MLIIKSKSHQNSVLYRAQLYSCFNERRVGLYNDDLCMTVCKPYDYADISSNQT